MSNISPFIDCSSRSVFRQRLVREHLNMCVFSLFHQYLYFVLSRFFLTLDMTVLVGLNMCSLICSVKNMRHSVCNRLLWIIKILRSLYILHNIYLGIFVLLWNCIYTQGVQYAGGGRCGSIWILMCCVCWREVSASATNNLYSPVTNTTIPLLLLHLILLMVLTLYGFHTILAWI